MKKYNIEYSKEAKEDLIEIKSYIKYNLQESNIAQKLISKIIKEINKPLNPRLPHAGINAVMIALTACPPIHACTPNQKHPSTPRTIDGTTVPFAPNTILLSIGYVRPYFVPKCPSITAKIITSVCPRTIVNNACAQDIPDTIRPLAT